MEFSARRAVFIGFFVILLIIGVSVLFFFENVGVDILHRRNETIEWNRFLSMDNWHRFSSKEGKFSVLFPGVPETTNMVVHNSTNSIGCHIFYVSANIQNGFGVGYMDSPGFAAWSQQTNAIDGLKNLELNMIEDPSAVNVVFEQESKFEGYPALEFEFASRKVSYSVRYKMILVHQRIYYLYVDFLTADPYPALRASFFNSFALN
jgi:hypothetical protein